MFDLSKLNENQRKAAEFNEGPCLVIAAAGTGKTTVLIHRVANLVFNGVNERSILLLTFTNKAANEMKERACKILEKDTLELTACTYHSFCVQYLRKYAALLGLNSSFTIIDGTDAVEVMKILKEEKGYNEEAKFPTHKALVNIFSTSINRELSIDKVVEIVYPEYTKYLDDIKIIKEAYIQYKLDKNILDYDDILTLFLSLIKNNDNICKKISDTFEYIMVDEYQDSNGIQFQILNELRKYENKNLMVVGDDQQSLYSFRGSRFDNIMHFPDEFENTEVIVLDENYRSNQEILDVANVIIDKAKEKYEKSLKGTHKVGRKPILMECYNTEEESKYILNEIEKLLCPPYNYEMKDIAVLIRNSKDSYMLESLLTRNYYSYEKYGGIKFLEKSFIKDIFAFLKVSVNDKDELAWFRLLQLYPNIGIVYAKKLTENILKNGVEELLNDKYNGRKYAEYFEDIYEKTTYLKGLDIKEQLDYLIDTYYFELQKTKIESSKMSKNKKTELLSEIKDNKEEAQVLKEFASSYTSTLKFLTDLTLETPEKSSSKDKITISTVHSAKGLEWKAVFIVNCINGSFPSPSRITPKGVESIKWIEEEEEEERRIFYVAVTRAKDYLYLTYPKVRFGYDKMPERTEISDFIDKDLRKTLDFQIKERETWYW